MDPRGMTVVRDFLTAEFDDQERKRIRGARERAVHVALVGGWLNHAMVASLCVCRVGDTMPANLPAGRATELGRA